MVSAVSNLLPVALAAVVVTVVCGQVGGLRHTSPSPASEFTLQPSNVTVPEGERAILKCKSAKPAHVCRWYYLENGLDIFDERVTPVLVKDFPPAHLHDCSIRIKQVHKIQEGQWLCQVLKFHSSKFIMTHPATLRVITESESVTWSPPVTQPTPPRNGRRGHDLVEFDVTAEEQIQDTPVGEPTTLKCQVNTALSQCSWIMPHGAVLSKSSDTSTNITQQYTEHYKISGDPSEGNCSLVVQEVRPQDEGNWRCVVRAVNSDEDVHGPPIHLHMMEHHLPSQEGTPLVDVEDETTNVVVVALVALCGLLLVIVVMLFTCLYRRVMVPTEETRRILKVSPNGSLEMPRKSLPITDLTATSVMAIEGRKRPPSYTDLHDLNQYLDMSCKDGGYIMMPGSSIRSSTSSRTTLSTLSTLPVGRGRSASTSTTISNDSPRMGNHVDNPFYNADFTSPPLPARPASVYSNSHIYEEIKEKKDELQMLDQIPEVSPVKSSPTYTNTSEDYLGYMIPNRSPTFEPLPQFQASPARVRTPLPEAQDILQHLLPVRDTAPVYSCIGENGLVAGSSVAPGPGYSRVGNIESNPMEAYDIPRAIPTEHRAIPMDTQATPTDPQTTPTDPKATPTDPKATPTDPKGTPTEPQAVPIDPLEQYDVPRRTNSETALDANTIVSLEATEEGLVGTIV